MNRTATTLLCIALLGAVGASAAEDKSAKAKDAASKVPNEIQYLPSTFFSYSDNGLDAAKLGKDVFFPNSNRTRPVKVEVKPVGVPTDHDLGPILGRLVLKGISGTGARRLAVLNNRTLAQGETWELKLNGQSHRVKCEEIKTRSVIISVEGFTEKKELQLRDGL